MVVAAATPQFEALRWTEPGAEFVVLSSQPSACLAYSPDDEPIVLAGLAMFNTPSLLGGQAAKAGLACSSCHVNGRDNPHFSIAGVTAAPGTADVTSSFFSAARGNGRFDPILIPDLAVSGKISRADAALEPFIRGLIVDEFSGAEPTPAILAALSAYVRAIRTCPDPNDMARERTIEDQLSITKAGLEGAVDMARRGDPQAVHILIGAVRHQLGLIAERYAGSKLNRERNLLLGASRELHLLMGRQQDPQQFGMEVRSWMARFETRVKKPLLQKHDASLYNPLHLSFVAPQRKSR